MSRRVWVCSLAVLLLGMAVPARAELVISFAFTPVPQGGTGTLDVYLTSTASPASPDQINDYGFQLQVSNQGTDNTQLSFDPNQDFTAVGNNSQYLFYQNSLGILGYVESSNTGYPNDTFIGLDSTANGDTVSISTATSYLLASLTVTTATDSPPNVNDSFTVSLLPTSGTGSDSGSPPPLSFFNTLDPMDNEIAYVPFTSTPGTVTISPASTMVPEPASIVSGLMGMVIVSGIWAARNAVKLLTTDEHR